MTKVLVLGAAGMLGHKVFQRARKRFQVVGAVRRIGPHLDILGKLAPGDLMEVDASDFGALERALDEVQPEWVVNCVGIIKQRSAAEDAALCTRMNADLPVFLAKAAHRRFRLVHISTDCVFSGSGGMYRESDEPDPVDLYGSSKLAGEVSGDGVLTLRTSMIGRELSGFHSLVEWFLHQRSDSVRGYTRAKFSGLTNIALADEIIRLIENSTELTGLYHVSAEPIDKFQLLEKIRAAFNLRVRIEPDDSVVIDRSLNSDRYRKETGFRPPSWDAMIAAMAADPTPYEKRWMEAEPFGGLR